MGFERPKRPLAAQDTQQIKSYAYAVSRDERFKGLRTKWRFWLLGNDLSEFVERELDNDLPLGVLQQTTDGIDDQRAPLIRADSGG
jgi:hypothetical protein